MGKLGVDCFPFLLAMLPIQVFLSREKHKLMNLPLDVQQYSSSPIVIPRPAVPGSPGSLRNADPLAQLQAHESQTLQTLGMEPKDLL